MPAISCADPVQALSGADAKRTRRALKNPAAFLSVFFLSLILSLFIFFPRASRRGRARRESAPAFLFPCFAFFLISFHGRPPPGEKTKTPFVNALKEQSACPNDALFLVWFVSCQPAKETTTVLTRRMDFVVGASLRGRCINLSLPIRTTACTIIGPQDVGLRKP